MADNIDQSRGRAAMFSRKEIPWHKLGKVVEEAPTSDVAIKLAELDYEVYKQPLYAKYTDELLKSNPGIIKKGIRVPGYFATVRDDTGAALGVVKGRYEVIQNTQAFEFIDNIVGSKQAIFETAGGLGGGERIFVTAKLPSNIKVKGVDTIEKYILFTTSHDGSGSVIAGFTPIRVVCNNTLNMAMSKLTNKVTIRHTKTAHSKIAIAQDIMGAYEKYSIYFQEALNELANKQVNEHLIDDTISSIILSDNETQLYKQYGTLNIDDISTRKKNEIELIKESIDAAPGQDIQRGTAYWLFNGVTSYYNNIKNYRSDESRLLNITEGVAKTRSQQVFDKLLAM